MAEGAPLLREYTLIAYRGFESLLLRHYPTLAYHNKKRHQAKLLLLNYNKTHKRMMTVKCDRPFVGFGFSSSDLLSAFPSDAFQR